jgi:hypothetical protein
MRPAALPTLMVLASACGGNESTASPSGPITDGSADVVTEVEGGDGPIAYPSSRVGVDARVCPFLAANYDRTRAGSAIAHVRTASVLV